MSYYQGSARRGAEPERERESPRQGEWREESHSPALEPGGGARPLRGVREKDRSVSKSYLYLQVRLELGPRGPGRQRAPAGEVLKAGHQGPRGAPGAGPPRCQKSFKVLVISPGPRAKNQKKFLSHSYISRSPAGVRRGTPVSRAPRGGGCLSPGRRGPTVREVGSVRPQVLGVPGRERAPGGERRSGESVSLQIGYFCQIVSPAAPRCGGCGQRLPGGQGSVPGQKGVREWSPSQPGGAAWAGLERGACRSATFVRL